LQHRLLGNQPSDATEDMERGSLLHAMLLGAGKQIVAVNAKDWRTNAAKAERDAAREAGRLPILQHKLAELELAVGRIRENIAALGIRIDIGLAEFKLEWRQDGVLCHGTPDWLAGDGSGPVTIYEIKTGSANPEDCSRKAVSLGWDLQCAAYMSACETLHPDTAGRNEFVWLLIETEAPFSVTGARPSGEMRELGRQRWARALSIWRRCLEANKWPGYATGIIELGPPPWAMARELEAGIVSTEL
jgi:hypothetical protein